MSYCSQQIRVFRAVTEFADSRPQGYSAQDLVQRPVLDPAAGGWATINLYARELTVMNRQAPVPSSALVNGRGIQATALRAIVTIDGEATLVGIGGGVRVSGPAAAVSVSVAASIVSPADVAPWDWDPGTGVWWDPPMNGTERVPFPMPAAEGAPDLFPIATTTVTCDVRGARPPVGDRVARLSHQVRMPGVGPLASQVVPVPSRARKVTILPLVLPDRGSPMPAVDAYWMNVGDLSVTRSASTTIAGYAAAYGDATVVPANATWLLVNGDSEAETPEVFHLTWELEL